VENSEARTAGVTRQSAGELAGGGEAAARRRATAPVRKRAADTRPQVKACGAPPTPKKLHTAEWDQTSPAATSSPVSRWTSSKPRAAARWRRCRAGALMLVIGAGAGIVVDQLSLEGAVDQRRQFARGRGDRLRLANPRRQTAVERAEGGLGATQRIGGHAQDRGRAIGGRGGPRAQELAAEILLFGASVSHDVKCWAVGQRRISVPISGISFKAVSGAMPSIWVKSTPPVT
jgi:hypothetical protein